MEYLGLEIDEDLLLDEAVNNIESILYEHNIKIDTSTIEKIILALLDEWFDWENFVSLHDCWLLQLERNERNDNENLY